MTEFKTAVEVLAASGPWAIVAGLAFAYWRQNQYIQVLHKGILETMVKNVEAMTLFKASVDGLKDTLNVINTRL